MGNYSDPTGECYGMLNDANEQLSKTELLLRRAIVELHYIHNAPTMELTRSAEGLLIVDEGMKLLGLKDLSEEPRP